MGEKSPGGVRHEHSPNYDGLRRGPECHVRCRTKFLHLDDCHFPHLLAFHVEGGLWADCKDREEATRQAAQVAEAAREETETLRTEIEADLAEARREARDRVREAESRAEAKEKEILAKARDEAERERQRSREEIESAKASALEELRATAVELGVGIAEKAISREFRSEDQQRLVSELQRDLSKN